MENFKRNFIVGLIFFGFLILVGIFTIVIKDLSMLKGHKGQMSVVFSKVSGLEPGHKVLASGMEVGQVRELELRDDGTVKVNINLTRPVKLFKDYQISVKDASALGGKYVNIDLGTHVEDAISLGQEMKPLAGESQPGLLDDPNLREAFVSLKKIAKDIEEGKGTVGLLITRREIYDNLEKATENIRLISEQLRTNQGTIGKLLYETEVYDKANTILGDIKEITKDIRQGKGTIGKLLQEDALHENLRKTIAEATKVMTNLTEITDKVRRGEGTIGKLFTDSAVYKQLESALTDARETMQNFTKVAKSINEGDGVIAKLLHDKQIGDDLKETVASVRIVVNRLKNGEGTIGKLLADETLYKEIRRVIKTFSDSIEDTREQVPISTFSGLLFKAF